jgi:probable F420-dependent oxidoreductase
MIVSVGLPTCMEGMMYPVPFASPEQVIQIAQLAEKLGYHSVWGNDHMTTQQYVRKEYATPPNFWEPLITYSFIAANTTTLKMGTGVLVLPMRRDLVVTAKQLATLDHFSGGRILLGVGVGAYREEFEALHPGWEAQRGDLLEEGIQAIKKLFTERSTTWHGPNFQFEDVEMYPKPVQSPLPIYFGGNNPNAVRRTALYGDGWLPAALPAETVRQRVAELKQMVEQNGRDFSKIDIAPQMIVCLGKTHEAAVKTFRNSQIYNHLVSLRTSTLKDQANTKFEETNLIGTPQELIEKIKKLQAAGVKHLCGTYFTANSVPELLDQMQLFAEDVMPSIH